MTGKGKWLSRLWLAAVFIGSWLPAYAFGSGHAATGTSETDMQRLAEVLRIIEDKYIERVPTEKLLEGAINGMVESLDPYSAYYPQEMFRKTQLDPTAEYGGLGIQLSQQKGMLTLVSTLEGTPAGRSGLKKGDRIIKIDKRSTLGLSVMESVELLRGPPGTKISIVVIRDSFAGPRGFTLTREVITVESVKFQMLDDDFGYVRLSRFQEQTAQDLKKALRKLHKESERGLKGLILDLRNNPGGLLEQGTAVADLFLRKGLIVSTKGRIADSCKRFTAHDWGTEPDYPMVVLINGGSASAAEIVAGALKDHHRAVILGTRSLGKGSVQSLLPLDNDTGLRLTIARFHTPSGAAIEARGITPDIVVRSTDMRECNEKSWWQEKEPHNQPVEAKRGGQNQTETGANTRPRQPAPGPQQDCQILRTIDLLKGWKSP